MNTDGIFITNPKRKFRYKKDVKFKTSKIGRAYITDSILSYFEKHYRENLEIEDYKTITGKGCIYNGQAGSGKTMKLVELVREALEDGKSPLVFSFTNKAVENVKDRLLQKGISESIRFVIHSIATFVNGMEEILTVWRIKRY